VEVLPSPAQAGIKPAIALAGKYSGSFAFYLRPVPLHCQVSLELHTIQAQQPFQG